MNNRRSFLKNNVLIFSNRIISKVVTFFLLVYFARKLSLDEFGALAILTSLSSVFVLLHDFGSNFVVVRETAKNQMDSKKLFFTTLVIKLLLGVLCFFVFMSIVRLMGYSDVIVGNGIFFALGMLNESFLLTLLKHYEGREEMRNSSIFVIAERVIIIGAISFLSGYFPLITSYGIGYVISNGLVFLAGLLLTVEVRHLGKYFEMSIAKRVLRMSYPFLIFNIFGVFYARMDVFILERIRTVSEVAVYRACAQLIESVYFIPVSLSVSLLPFFSRYFVSEPEKLKKLFPLIYNKVLIMGLFIAITMSTKSELILAILYKNKYTGGSAIFAVIAFAIPLYFVNNILGNLLVAAGREKYQTLSAMCSAVGKFIALLIFINFYGVIGAALSFILGELIAFAVQYLGLSKASFYTTFLQGEILSLLLLLTYAAVLVSSSSMLLLGAVFIITVIILILMNLKHAKLILSGASS